MGYYIRVLATSAKLPRVAFLRRALHAAGFGELELESTSGKDTSWTQLELRHHDETPICLIERDPVKKGALGEAEIEELIIGSQDCEPASAVAWLQDYLPKVKCIYAFQILSGANEDGWDAVNLLQHELRDFADGIFQADGEGFSNEQGWHILWQFDKGAKGKWTMAVRDAKKRWVSFMMDLSNKKHREAFKAGKVPSGVKPLEYW